ncbi:unnamed protein product [Euphydryas editha]|uniref:CRAL-TRIO domain-containing protein n=1 Tax=Euphydryas editha TaxID=104508 RepID=A0AAU9UAX5_EUPED|nr:unnamed protein product [Euphydryas editha]
MESTSYHPLFQVTQEEMKNVRQSYNLDVKKINENLDILEEWFKKQDHLVEALPYIKRDMLERFHILGRGSIEKTKAIIDKVLTIRGLISEFFMYDTKTFFEEFETFLDNVILAPLPKINPKDCTRIFLIGLMNADFEDIKMADVAKFSCFINSTRMHYDYNFSHHLIFDFKHIKASAVTKINPIVLRKIEVVFMDSYKARVKGLHFINAPPFIQKVVAIFNFVLKEKLAKRIYIHSTYDDLYQHIPREILPKEYGELMKDFIKSDAGRRIIEDSSKIVANESRRSSIKFNEEYMGMPGSFKKLNVD